jgi:hypothetical protein
MKIKYQAQEVSTPGVNTQLSGNFYNQAFIHKKRVFAIVEKVQHKPESKSNVAG